MNTQKNISTRKNTVPSFNRFDFAKSNTSCTAHQTSAKESRTFELLTFVTNEKVNHAARVATITSLTDRELLIDIAIGNGPLSIRKNTLSQIDTLCSEKPLEKSQLQRLLPCLDEKDLIALAVVIMDMCDYAWWTHSTEKTVQALCLALHECTCIHESVLLEDAFACLAYNRRDLNRALYASSPESFLTKTMYAPINMTNLMLLDLSREDNVA